MLGGSIAGLLAAVASAAPGRTVTILERDVLPDRPEPRPGVPQGRQPHVYLHRGLLDVEALLPGFREELRQAGAVPVDTGDLAWLAEAGWAPEGRREYEVLSATRPLVEHLVRRRVLATPGVELRDAVRVERIHRGGSAGPAWYADLADGTAIPADLLVDATGRTSRLPVWLAAEGIGPVPTRELDARVGYATHVHEIDASAVHAAGVVLLQSPGRPGGLALPVEGGRWLLTAVGAGENRPPRDAGALREFLHGLADPAMAELQALGTPVGDVAVHRQTGNRRHRYEAVADWPAGLLAIGDAFCVFNPVYGQGITVAAGEALVLRRALERGLAPGDERRLLRRFGRVVAVPWAIATGEDLRYTAAGHRVPVALSLFGAWSRELGRLAGHGDRRAHSAIAAVYHLMAPPWALVHPLLLLAAVRAHLRGYGPATPRPRVVRDPGRGSPHPPHRSPAPADG